MARHSRITLGVVSGRRLEDVSSRVQHVAEFVACLHGLEIDGQGSRFITLSWRAWRPSSRGSNREARHHLAWCPGCLIENKEFALTCHVRQAPPDLGEVALEEFESLAEALSRDPKLRLLIGAQARELLPSFDWDKGRAVRMDATRVSRAIGIRSRHLFSVTIARTRTRPDLASQTSRSAWHRPHTPMTTHECMDPRRLVSFLGEMTRLMNRE